MPTFEITGPDGKVYEIEGANPQGALAALQKHLGAAPAAPAAPVDPAMGYGFDATVPTTEPKGQAVAAMPYAEQMANVARTFNNGARLAANGLTFGLADKFAGGMDAVTGQAPSYDAGVRAQRAQTQALRDANPVPAAVAEGAGGLAGGAGLIKNGITLAGRMGPSVLARVIGYSAEGGAYGAAHGAGNTYSDKPSDYVDNARAGATSGAAVGLGLPVLGSAAGGIYRGAAAFLGPRVEGLGRGASALLRGSAQADAAGIQNLPAIGDAAMLPDAGPAMRGLAQGAGTGVGEGRSQLVNALVNRDKGTAARLGEALDTNLGPAPIPSRLEAELAASRQALSPDYQTATAAAGRVNTAPLAQQLDAIALSERGDAQRAAQRVRGMLDAPVQPGSGFNARPPLSDSAETLLNTRQAIDGMMATEKDPNTIRVLTNARNAVDAELAGAVPGLKDVDAQFAELSRQSDALKRGQQVLDGGKTAIRPAELADEIQQGAVPPVGQMTGPSAAPMRLQQGVRADIDRRVGTNINDLNQLERTFGTPEDWNSQKLGQVFGEEPRDRVAQAIAGNRQMRDTYQGVVQNSQTAQRTAAARSMEGSEGGIVRPDLTLTGLGFKAANAIAKALSGASSASTKDEIGRLLATQGPEVQRIANALLQSAQTTGMRASTIARLLSSPELIGALTPAAGRK